MSASYRISRNYATIRFSAGNACLCMETQESAASEISLLHQNSTRVAKSKIGADISSVHSGCSISAVRIHALRIRTV